MANHSSNSFLLALLLFSITINSISTPCSASSRTTNTEFIRTSCGCTTYPTLCFTSLSTQATAIRTSPKLMAHAALNISLSYATSTSNMMVRLSRTHGIKPREAAAMTDCVEELSEAVEELRRSVGQMGRMKDSNFGIMVNDVQTWVSAALTDEGTCMDGFQGKAMDGKVKSAVRQRILVIAHLTSNGLALVNRFASIHG